MGFPIAGRRRDRQTADHILLAASIDDAFEESLDLLVEEGRVVDNTPGGLDNLLVKRPRTKCPEPLAEPLGGILRC
jgi:hypothetical protein